MIQVNDKVKIKEDLQDGKEYNGIRCHYGMLKFKGKLVTVGNIPYSEQRPDVFNVREDLEGYLWSVGMLDKKQLCGRG